jgi:MFS family permease
LADGGACGGAGAQRAAAVVRATDVAGGAERHPGEASATAGDAARAPAGTVHLCAHLHGVVVLSGKVPPRLEQNDHVGFLFACYGGTCFLGALSFGRLSDRVGRRPVVFVGFLMHMVTLVLVSYADTDHRYLFYLSFASLGLRDWMRRFSSC